MRLRMIAIALGLLLLLVVQGGHRHAHAHSRLERSEPSADTVLDRSPEEVRVWVTQELRLSGNALTVADPSGSRVDNGDGRVDQSDPDRKQLVVGLPALASGTYTVTYTTSSAEDGHEFTGSFSFVLELADDAAASIDELAGTATWPQPDAVPVPSPLGRG